MITLKIVSEITQWIVVILLFWVTWNQEKKIIELTDLEKMKK